MKRALFLTLATHGAIWTAMIRTGKSIGSGDVDEIFDTLEESLQGGANYGFDAGDLQQFGQFVGTIERQFERSDVCG